MRASSSATNLAVVKLRRRVSTHKPTMSLRRPRRRKSSRGTVMSSMAR